MKSLVTAAFGRIVLLDGGNYWPALDAKIINTLVSPPSGTVGLLAVQ
jgi:hypothetical protein